MICILILLIQIRIYDVYPLQMTTSSNSERKEKLRQKKSFNFFKQMNMRVSPDIFFFPSFMFGMKQTYLHLCKTKPYSCGGDKSPPAS